MLVSRKNLTLIHFIPAEVAASVDMTKASHECVHLLPIAGLSGKLQQPFPEGCVEGPALRAGHQPCLLNQVLIGTESNVLHTVSVYTRTVRSALESSVGMTNSTWLREPRDNDLDG